ncbi:SMI1/KNR4 family protein [Streptomyces cyaneofuscatus]|uniref:SMI1/KNR4 family protein n=1 Tax=Streptomyces cyaneofuscatus TaxID=66883 RepID=UPI0034230FF2
MKSDPKDIIAQWRRLEGWLAAHSPGDYSTLRRGATGEEIDHVENELTYSLHPSLKKLFSLRDGVNKRRTSLDPGAFLLNYSMLSSGRALDEQRGLESVIEDAIEEGIESYVIGTLADARWVPFAGTFSGSILFVDHRPGVSYGKIGEIIPGNPEYVVLWDSLEAMLSDLCDALDAWAPLSGKNLTPILTGDGHLQWGHE